VHGFRHVCPHADGTCCKNRQYCCPGGYRCDADAKGWGVSCVSWASLDCDLDPHPAACRKERHFIEARLADDVRE